MSSKEIAELTGKEHKHVMRDIRGLLEALDHDADGNVQNWTNPQNGQSYPVFNLPKNLTLALVTGYSAVLRLRIIDRWQELEARVAPPALPNFGNPAEAARAWALQFERAEQQAQKVIEVSQELARSEVIASNVVKRNETLLELVRPRYRLGGASRDGYAA